MKSPAWVYTSLLVGVCSGGVCADTIYHCKAYTGALFWSRNHCQQHGALVHRVAPVPDGLPFNTQVRLAEQANGVGSKSTTTEARKGQAAQKATASAQQKELKQQAKCDKLRDQIDHQDSMARLARSGTEQDRTAERKRRYQVAYGKAGC